MTKLSKNIKTSLAALMLCSSLASANSSYVDYQGVAFNSGATGLNSTIENNIGSSVNGGVVFSF